MLGFIVTDKEKKELEYIVKRELDEILYDMQDDRIDHVVKRAMEERYKILFGLFKRVAPAKECLKYMRVKTMRKKDQV